MTAMRAQRGFTIIEMIIVLAIMAVIATLAAPSMRSLLTTQSVKALSYDLVGDLTFARAEAISRSTNVALTVNNGTDYMSGWSVTVSGVPAPVRVQSPKTGALTAGGSTNSITFNRSGRTTVPFNVTIAPMDPSATADMKRCVTLDPSGRVRSVTGACS